MSEMSTITVTIPTHWKEDFIAWMCNCGEQDFMDIIEDRTAGRIFPDFTYPGYQMDPRRFDEIIIKPVEKTW